MCYVGGTERTKNERTDFFLPGTLFALFRAYLQNFTKIYHQILSLSLFRYVFWASISLSDSSSRQRSISRSFLLVLFSFFSPQLYRDASFFGLNPAERGGASARPSRILPRCPLVSRPKAEARLWFGLIRRSARCPASIRNPFVGPDLFFRRILSKGRHRRGDRSFGIVHRKKSFFKNNHVIFFRHHP